MAQNREGNSEDYCSESSNNSNKYENFDLRIFTLGRVKVCSAGHKLVETSSGLPKKWSLFLVLYFHSHEVLGVDYLVEKLGLEKNEAPGQSLRMMIYRLRENFSDLIEGKEIILTQDEGYTFNEDIKDWLDAAEFEKMHGGGLEAAEEDNNPAAAEEKLQRAFELYEGPFMAGVEENLWILNQRRRYREMFLEVVEELSMIRQKKGQLVRAEEILDAALKYCPMETEIHDRLIEVARRQQGELRARQRAEQSVTFFRRNGLEVPESLEEHISSAENAAAGRDPVEYLRERSAAEDNNLLECDPDSLVMIYRTLSSVLSGKPPLIELTLSGLETESQMGQAEQALRMTLKNTAENLRIICHWDSGHFVMFEPDADGEAAFNSFSRLERRFTEECTYSEAEIEIEIKDV